MGSPLAVRRGGDGWRGAEGSGGDENSELVECSAVSMGDACRGAEGRWFGTSEGDSSPVGSNSSTMAGRGSGEFEVPGAPGLVESQSLSTSDEVSKASRAERASFGSADARHSSTAMVAR